MLSDPHHVRATFQLRGADIGGFCSQQFLNEQKYK
jgi:hypothetical protein